jgi:hypothetical protein
MRFPYGRWPDHAFIGHGAVYGDTGICWSVFKVLHHETQNVYSNSTTKTVHYYDVCSVMSC